MNRKKLNTSGVVSLDGILALAIVVACIFPLDHITSDLSDWYNSRVTFIDAAFGLLFVIGWRYCFNGLNLYNRFSTVPSRIMSIGKGSLIMTAPVVAYMTGFHRSDVTVRSITTLFVALFIFGITRVFLVDFVFNRLATRDPRRAIILGSGRRAGKAWREIRTRYHSSITVLGFVDSRNLSEMAPEIAQLHLGTVEQLEDILLKNVVDVLLIAMPIKSCYEEMQNAIKVAESVGISIIYLGDIYHTTKIDENEEIFKELAPEHNRYLVQRLVKRVVDIVCALLGLIVMSPAMLVIAIGIKLTSKGPVLFRQPRYGYRRRLFNIYKFRSMVDNAEAVLPHIEHINEADGPHFKIKNDPRVTSFGKLLRSTSLDELPQLLNVLRGEMSMVGPRPMSVRDVSLFNDATLMRRFNVQAGITGLWQVSGRSNISFDEWMALDVRYIESWSLSNDLQIMFRTVGAVLRRSGAM